MLFTDAETRKEKAPLDHFPMEKVVTRMALNQGSYDIA